MNIEDGELSSVRRNGKSEAAFRTISEVADELDVPQHVLRFWEGKFPQVKPLKRGGGRRYYRPDDVALLRRIRDLLYSEGYTIKGVQKLLKEGGAGIPASSGRDGAPSSRAAEQELELGLHIHDPDPPDSYPLPTVADECGVVEVLDRGVPTHDGGETSGLSRSLRRELEDLLTELEQMRSLLQPR
ncbi:MerR family transcriptional regulator [Paramagnetospirillum kuznetsovii]|uniref:MerR family transcriptional regulator n=1 Tax=Paramagnetospirillum kuznetsovii TaxID=2053833 RepID=A0A364NZP6_9PROT|nr:MerR family transcriptional regulator [Paramagnetospirillum kuznetsovii]RAU22523.1 MerR family transcriptional regulator [Paramagnetospirillum kuznetsovii]